MRIARLHPVIVGPFFVVDDLHEIDRIQTQTNMRPAYSTSRALLSPATATAAWQHSPAARGTHRMQARLVLEIAKRSARRHSAGAVALPE
jgi:hypothetical protein